MPGSRRMFRPKTPSSQQHRGGVPVLLTLVDTDASAVWMSVVRLEAFAAAIAFALLLDALATAEAMLCAVACRCQAVRPDMRVVAKG